MECTIAGQYKKRGGMKSIHDQPDTDFSKIEYGEHEQFIVFNGKLYPRVYHRVLCTKCHNQILAKIADNKPVGSHRHNKRKICDTYKCQVESNKERAKNGGLQRKKNMIPKVEKPKKMVTVKLSAVDMWLSPGLK